MLIEHMEENKGKSSVVPESKCSSDQTPLKIRVLILEDDDKYLSTLENMLNSCGYSVSKCQRAKEALSLLEEDKSRYDIILSDAQLPDMHGFKLLEKVVLEMEVPVVLILLENKRDSIMKDFLHGASGYVIEPIASDSLGNLAEHVLLKKKDELIRVLLVGEVDKPKNTLKMVKDEVDEPHSEVSNDRTVQETLATINEADATKSTLKRVKDEIDEGNSEVILCDAIKVKRQRVIWTQELQDMFEIAVKELGDKYAVPKKILEKMQNMGVHYLTRENVASHLQKYRIQNMKKENQSQIRNLLGFRPRMSLKQSDTLNGELKIQSCTSSDQLSFPSLTPNSNSKVIVVPDQRNDNRIGSSQVMGSDYKMLQQISDDGRLGSWTPAIMDNFQPGETPDYHWDINESCQFNEIEPSRLMIDGPGYFPFGYEIASTVVNSASMEPNAATVEHLTMSINRSFPLQVQDTYPTSSTFYGTNSFVDVPDVGGDEYVNLGNSAPFCNEPFVGNPWYQTSVQADHLDFDYDFTQKPFIEQPGSGLAKTK